MKSAWLPLILVVLVAAAPRALDLEHPGVTYDEFYDIEDSQRFCASGRVLEPISDGFLNGQAPFFLACALPRSAASPEITGRTLAVVAGLVSVVATYLLARRLLPRPWALLAAALLGLSPWSVAASRLAFSHGHGFAVPWLLLSLWAALSRRRRLADPSVAAFVGASAGLAVGNDLLAGPWTLTLLALLMRRVAPGRRARCLTWFASAWLLGLALASPMYLAHPWRAVQDVAARLAWWDSQTGHLWLGAEQAHLPLYYYPLVLLVRLSLPIVLVLAATALARPTFAMRILLPCLWPIFLLVLKGWKSPFYLTPFLPILYIISAATLRRWARALPRAWNPKLAILGPALVLATQVVLLCDSHPDHLMTGIRYSAALYGDFAGPAVSHGQWVRAALEHVQRDGPNDDSVVLVPLGYAPRQVEHYAARLSLRQVHTADRLRHGIHPRDVNYVIASHDVSAHADGRRFNEPLLRLLATGQFELLATVRSAGFPLARVWKRSRAHSMS